MVTSDVGSKKWIIATSIALGLFMSFTTAMAAASKDSVSTQRGATNHYVAFGDSLTAGYEPYKGRYYGFVDRLYEQALYHGRAALVNDGIDGLTSTGLRTWLDSVVKDRPIDIAMVQPYLDDPNDGTIQHGKHMFAQPEVVRNDITTANVITITIGGNDFLNSLAELLPMSAMDRATFAASLNKTYDANVKQIISDLRTLNPNARIRIANQYNPLWSSMIGYGEFENLATGFTKNLQSVIASLNDTSGQGASTSTNASVDAPLQMVDIAATFTGHQLSATHIAQADVHPTQLGYSYKAEDFAASLWKNPVKLSGSSNSITVVADGRVLSSDEVALINGSAYVQVRALADAFGLTVNWDATLEEIRWTGVPSNGVTGDSIDMRLHVGSSDVQFNGSRATMAGTVHLVNGRSYAPLRSLVGAIGGQVVYVAPDNAAYIVQ